MVLDPSELRRIARCKRKSALAVQIITAIRKADVPEDVKLLELRKIEDHARNMRNEL